MIHQNPIRMYIGILFSLLLLCVFSTGTYANDLNLVEDGEPRAQIVIDKDPPRLVEIAAEELRLYIKKISGATLPIATSPSDEADVTIYVGPSTYTDRMDITAQGLEHGGFRMVSGADYLVLLGHELDFEPPEPWARRNSDRERAQADWDEMTEDLTDSAWGNPLHSLYRHYNEETDTWFHDESGSLNAVYELLRTLGVRWYMPGELGEVVPQQDSITVPALDRTVAADFSVRRFFGPAYFIMSRDDLMWMRRLGLNYGYPTLGTIYHVHGMRPIHRHEKMKEQHPEYYALVGGVRDTKHRGTGHVCYSSEGFTRETANYARALFDLLDEPTVDLWPQDGLRACECEQCVELTPAEAIFRFVDRVARDVYKTHPDRMITSGAYASYRLPPDNIDQFPPNVGITVAFPRPGLDQPETWGTKRGGDSYEALLGGWSDKVADGKLLGNSNHRGNGVLMTRSIARDLRWRKGRSLGDWNEVGHQRGGDVRGGRETGKQTWQLGVHHLNMYVNARLLWDAEQDLDALLDEYYQAFYGPAAEQVQSAFEFAEASYTRGQGRARLKTPDYIELIERLHAARDTAGDTVYGRRIAYILEEEPSLQELQQRLEQQRAQEEARKQAPLVIGTDAGAEQAPPTYSLVDLQTGETPDIKTSFHVQWDDGTLIFDIRCEDPDMENLFVTRDVWGGDSVAILLETPYHAYYQMEINPDGKLVDADREYGAVNTNWSSLTEVETERGEDYWRVIARIPVMNEAAGALDPLHNVVGEKPTKDAPWFVQVGRVRIRDLEKSAFGLAPTGGSYHEPEQFHRLVIE